MTSTETTTAINDLEAGTWEVDTAHSMVEFSARHLMVARVKGRFTSFRGSLHIYEDPLRSRVEASVDMASVDTGDEEHDAHLRAPDFFDVERYSQMTLVSTGIRPEGDRYVLSADVTVRGVTRPVDFELDFHGVTADPWGGSRAGFTAVAEVNRKDWGLVWNVPLDGGGVLVSDKVKITLEVEAVKA